jgi:hypothetical protein
MDGTRQNHTYKLEHTMFVIAIQASKISNVHTVCHSPSAKSETTECKGVAYVEATEAAASVKNICKKKI